MNITILVPTKNRFYYVNRLINYYSSTNFKGKILILDSSDQLNKEKIREKISKNKSINIEYHFSIGYPCFVMKKYMNRISTDYAVFSGDDDYLIISGIKKNLNFLEKNKNFIGCTGGGMSVHFSEDKKKINYILDYPQAKITNSTCTSRLTYQFKNYKVPIFSVFRRKYFKKFLEFVPSHHNFKKICPDKMIADEYIIQTAMVAYGKIQHLNHPYLVRCIHPDRDIDGLVVGHNKDWIKSANYKKSTNYFFKTIAKIISKIDKIDIYDAESLIQDLFNDYVKRTIITSKQSITKKFIYNNFFLTLMLFRKLRYFFINNAFSRSYDRMTKNKKYKKILLSIEGAN